MIVDCSECPCLTNDSEWGYDCNLGFTIEEDRWVIEGLQAKRLPCSFDCALKSVEYDTDKVYLPIETDINPLTLEEALEGAKQARVAKTIEDMGGL